MFGIAPDGATNTCAARGRVEHWGGHASGPQGARGGPTATAAQLATAVVVDGGEPGGETLGGGRRGKLGGLLEKGKHDVESLCGRCSLRVALLPVSAEVLTL